MGGRLADLRHSRLHHAQAAGQGAIGHRPHDHVGAFRHQADEVPEGILGRCGLRIASIGFHLHRMDEVGELIGVLNEEEGDVVADQVQIALAGVHLHGEPAQVPRRVH